MLSIQLSNAQYHVACHCLATICPLILTVVVVGVGYALSHASQMYPGLPLGFMFATSVLSALVLALVLYAFYWLFISCCCRPDWKEKGIVIQHSVAARYWLALYVVVLSLWSLPVGISVVPSSYTFMDGLVLSSIGLGIGAALGAFIAFGYMSYKLWREVKVDG